MTQARREGTFCLALLCTALLLLLSGACGDKKKDRPKEGEGAAPTLASVEGLHAVPASATAVIGLDVKEMVASPVVLRAVDRMFARDPDLKSELSAVLSACALDVQKDLSAATVALVPRGEGTDSLLIAKGRFSESALTACLGRFLAEDGGRLESSKFEGRTIYHQVRSEAPGGVWLSFGSKDTLLIASARELLELSLGEGEKLATARSGLARLAGRANTEATIWAMAAVDDAVGQGLVAATGGQVKPAKSILGSVDLEGGGMNLLLAVEMASAGDAKVLISQASIQIQGMALVLQIDAIGPLLKKLTLVTEGSWSLLGWQLSEEEVAEIMGANLLGLSSTIDNNDANEQNPAPKSDLEGDEQNGNRHPDAGNEKDL